MMVTRIQLYCQCFDTCGCFFPPEGPVDGAIFAQSMLREEARKQGWKRVQYTDYCPKCAARAAREDGRV